MRPIDAELLLSQFVSTVDPIGVVDKNNIIHSMVKDADVISLIEAAPTVDLQQGRVKGTWIRKPHKNICSVCGGLGNEYLVWSPYCPWCGSEMELTEEFEEELDLRKEKTQ